MAGWCRPSPRLLDWGEVSALAPDPDTAAEQNELHDGSRQTEPFHRESCQATRAVRWNMSPSMSSVGPTHLDPADQLRGVAAALGNDLPVLQLALEHRLHLLMEERLSR